MYTDNALISEGLSSFEQPTLACSMGKKWLPLESNPDVLNDFSRNLGLDTKQYSFHDVYGMDPVCPVLCEISPIHYILVRSLHPSWSLLET